MKYIALTCYDLDKNGVYDIPSYAIPLTLHDTHMAHSSSIPTPHLHFLIPLDKAREFLEHYSERMEPNEREKVLKAIEE